MIKVVVETNGKVITDDKFTDRQTAVKEAMGLTSKFKHAFEASVYEDNLMVAWINYCPPSKSKNEEEME